MLRNHSAKFILVSCYVIIKIIYVPWILSLISKWGIGTVFAFVFQVLHLHVPNQKNHHCSGQIIRSILLIGLCCPSNEGILHKWNTCSKPYSHIPSRHWYYYFLFLDTFYACLAVLYSHIDVNWHLRDTWTFGVFLKIWKLEPHLLTASIFFPLRNPFSCLLYLVYCLWFVAVIMLE